jgi:hypothetical protein
MTTVNLVGHLDLAVHRNSRSLLTGFHIRAAIARAAHIEREGITSVRTSASDRYVSTDDRGRHSGGLGAIERLQARRGQGQAGTRRPACASRALNHVDAQAIVLEKVWACEQERLRRIGIAEDVIEAEYLPFILTVTRWHEPTQLDFSPATRPVQDAHRPHHQPKSTSPQVSSQAHHSTAQHRAVEAGHSELIVRTAASPGAKQTHDCRETGQVRQWGRVMTHSDTPDDGPPAVAEIAVEPGRHRRFTVEQVKEALAKSGGIMTAAASLLQCGRKTLYRYLEYYPELVTFMREEIKPMVGDLAKGVVLSHIEAGSLPAATFYLKAQCRDEGWGDRVENVHTGDIALTHQQGSLLRAELDALTYDDLVRRITATEAELEYKRGRLLTLKARRAELEGKP